MIEKGKYLLISPDFPPPLTAGYIWIFNLIEHSGEDFDILTGPLKRGLKEVVSHRHRLRRSRFLVDSRNPSRIRLLLGYFYMIFFFFSRNLVRPYEAVVVNPGAVGNSLLFLLGRFMMVKVVGMAYAEELTVPLYGRHLKSRLKKFLLCLGYRRAAGFIAVSHFSRRLLVEIGVGPDRVDVIPPFPITAKVPQTLLEKKPGFRVLSVGRLIERKGFHRLLEAIGHLYPEIPEIHLTIAGDGPMRALLEKQIRENNLDSFVTLRGEVSDDELANLYQESHLFVLAHMRLENGDTEGCPSVFLEALASGTPVIGGTGGGGETAIRDGINGFVVDCRDSKELARRMKEILTDPSLAKRMVEAGREGLAKYHNLQKAGMAFGQSIRRIVAGESASAYQQEVNDLDRFSTELV